MENRGAEQFPYSQKMPLPVGGWTCWLDRLSNGDHVEAGTTHFLGGDKLFIEFDASPFNKALEDFNKPAYEIKWSENENAVEALLKDAPKYVPLKLIYLALAVQRRVDELLGKVTGEHHVERNSLYQFGKEPPKLSDFVGKAFCVERALLAQYLLQKLEIQSSFISGALVADENLDDAFSSPHAWVVINDLDLTKGKSVVFDVARPFTNQNLPALYTTGCDITYKLLQGHQDKFVESTVAYLDERYLGFSKQYFGVGRPIGNVDYSMIIKK